jgi:hypothetical protein
MAAPWTPEQDPYDPRSVAKLNIQGWPLDADSDAKADRFRAIIPSSRPTTTENGEGPTIYVGSDAGGDPTWTFNGSITSPAPSTMVNGGGSDRPLIVLCADNPAYGGGYTEVRCWQATINNTAKTVSANGLSLHRYNNDEALLQPTSKSNYWSIENPAVHRTSGNGRESNGEPQQGGGAGNGLSYLYGLMQREHLDYFIENGWEEGFPFAIRFAYGPGGQTVNGPVSGDFRAPATKSDQIGSVGSGIVPMGQFFRLPLSVDPSTRTVPGHGEDDPETILLRAFIVTLQKRGIMVADGTGGGPNFYAEAEATAKWHASVASGGLAMDNFGGRSMGCAFRDNTSTDGISRTANDGVPWSLLEAVDTTVENTDPFFGGGSPPEAPAAPIFFDADIMPGGLVKLTTRLQYDQRRDKLVIIRRSTPRTLDEPEVTDTVVYEHSAEDDLGLIAGNIDSGGAWKTSTVQEIKLVKGFIPARSEAATYDLRVYCDGNGGGAGSALLSGLLFPTTTPDDKPDGAARIDLGGELAVAEDAIAEWRTVDALTFPAGPAADFWFGIIIGGDPNVLRIPRTALQSERYVDTGVDYDNPPATCPVTGVGTSRSSIHLVLRASGEITGGTFVTEDAPGEGDHHYTAFAVNLETP